MKLARNEWILDRRLKRLELNPDHDVNVPKKGHAARSVVFADWLASTFHNQIKHEVNGEARDLVVDVACGRANIATQLFIDHSLECVLVDPRSSTDVGRPSKTQIKKMVTMNIIWKPRHLQCLFQDIEQMGVSANVSIYGSFKISVEPRITRNCP